MINHFTTIMRVHSDEKLNEIFHNFFLKNYDNEIINEWPSRTDCFTLDSVFFATKYINEVEIPHMLEIDQSRLAIEERLVNITMSEKIIMSKEIFKFDKCLIC